MSTAKLIAVCARAFSSGGRFARVCASCASCASTSPRESAPSSNCFSTSLAWRSCESTISRVARICSRSDASRNAVVAMFAVSER